MMRKAEAKAETGANAGSAVVLHLMRPVDGLKKEGDMQPEYGDEDATDMLETPVTSHGTRYVVAFYELDRRYGGPEEGGWWYDCGNLVRLYKVFRTQEAARKACIRANDLLHRIQRNKRSLGSVLYNGGRYCAQMYTGNAPQYFPAARPYYE